MAQDYLNEELFSTEDNDLQDLDTAFNTMNIEPEEIVAASDDDRKTAKETGNANKPKPTAKPKEEEPEEQLEVIDEMDEDLETDTTKTTSKDGTTQESVLSEMAAVAEGLFKAGIWSREEGEDETVFPDTEEEFVERFDYEGRKVANNYVTQIATRHGDDAKDLFDAVFVKGVPVKEFLNKWQENQDFKTMDLTDESNQVRVVETMLKEQGLSDDKIRDKIRKMKLAEELEEEADTYHEVLVKRQDANLKQIE